MTVALRAHRGTAFRVALVTLLGGVAPWLGTLGPSASGRALAQEAPAPERARYRRIGLREAIAQSVRRNADLRIARAQRDVARAEARAAAAPLYPRVDFQLGYRATTDPVQAFGIQLRQGTFGREDLAVDRLIDPDVTDDFAARFRVSWGIGSAPAWAARDAAEDRATSEGWRTQRMREATALRTRVLYYDAARLEARIAAATAAVEAAEATVARFRRRREEGMLTRADLLQGQAELAAARAERIQATAQRRAARLRLAVHLGWDDGALPVPRDALAAPAPREAERFDPAARADLRARSAAVGAAEAAHDGARLAYLPTLRAFADYELHDPDYPFGTAGTNWTVGLMLQWTAFDGFAREAAVERADAEARAAQLAYEQAVREARASVREARRTVEAARGALEASAQARDAAREGRDLMRRRFEEGLATASDLLQAEARATAMRARHIDALAAYHMARARLRFALGGGLEGTP
jgi:outer membrane protein TolC